MSAIPGRGRYTESARIERLEWLRRRSRMPLASLGADGILAAEQLTGNIENFIGTVALPVGLAGPLLFTGGEVHGSVVAPLVTTEGALVASVSRGARAITRGGGVATRTLGQRMTRAPAYEFSDLAAAAAFVDWLGTVRPGMEGQVREVSRHTTLVTVEPFQIGRYVHLLLGYETADAAGQNMTTVATWRICQWLDEALVGRPEITPVRYFVEGNLSGDKKVSHLSMTGGRGIRVTAECHLDRATVEATLKTTPESLMALYHCSVLASQQAGMVGHNINVSNVISAMFIATGQDVACVHESGAGIFSLEPTDGGLLATLLLPNLVLGTVGGGTGLPQQRDLLAVLGCAGEGTGRRLAEIICGFALALDVSTCAAVSGGQFADAHQRLGRARRVNWLTREELQTVIAPRLLRGTIPSDEVTVTAAPAEEFGGSGILSDLAARGERRKFTGLHPLRVDCVGLDGQRQRLGVVAKIKALDDEVLVEIGKIASLGGQRLGAAWRRHGRAVGGFSGAHRRELAIYRSQHPSLVDVLPRCYGWHDDPDREAYVLLLEDLRESAVLLDPADGIRGWTSAHVGAAIAGIAGVHSGWLERREDAAALGVSDGLPGLAAAGELWTALIDHNTATYPDLLKAGSSGLDLAALARWLVERIASWTAELAAMPRTLVHHDFNPRNIAFRPNGRLPIVYDWELATWHVPQRDLAELLTFVLTPEASPDEVESYLVMHWERLGGPACGADLTLWRRGYQLALWDLLLSRLQLYLLAHEHREYPFLERVVGTTRRLCEIEAQVGRVGVGHG